MLEKLSKQLLIEITEKRLKQIEKLELENLNLQNQIDELEESKCALEIQNKKLTRIIIEMNAEKYIK